MEAYTDFAYVYDTMMKDIPYAEWAEYVKTLLQDDKIGKGATVAELGCGTGSFTLEMSKLGYTMTGVDPFLISTTSCINNLSRKFMARNQRMIMRTCCKYPWNIRTADTCCHNLYQHFTILRHRFNNFLEVKIIYSM